MSRLPSPTIPNPEFLADEDVRGEVSDQCIDLQTLHSALPEDYGYAIPEEGAWICVMTPPHTEIEIPYYSLWHAKPFYRHRQFRLTGPSGRKRNMQWPCLLARILTPDGDLYLYPGEYSCLRNGIGPLLPEVDRGLTMHWLGEGEPGDFADKLFYMRARGFSRQDAMTILLPELEDQGFVYFTVDV